MKTSHSRQTKPNKRGWRGEPSPDVFKGVAAEMAVGVCEVAKSKFFSSWKFKMRSDHVHLRPGSIPGTSSFNERRFGVPQIAIVRDYLKSRGCWRRGGYDACRDCPRLRLSADGSTCRRAISALTSLKAPTGPLVDVPFPPLSPEASPRSRLPIGLLLFSAAFSC